MPGLSWNRACAMVDVVDGDAVAAAAMASRGIIR